VIDLNELDEPFHPPMPSSFDIDLSDDTLSIVNTPTGQELVLEDTWDEVTTEYNRTELNVLREASNPSTCPTMPPPGAP
jgi:hypothetical protein